MGRWWRAGPDPAPEGQGARAGADARTAGFDARVYPGDAEVLVADAEIIPRALLPARAASLAAAGEHEPVPDLVPVRMLNEYAYCPRLFFLEWVEGDFRDSADTLDGRFQHRRVDRRSGRVPDAQPRSPAAGARAGTGANADADAAAATDPQERPRIHARSVDLSAPGLGLVTRIDLLEADGNRVTPVDYKRGRSPSIPGGAWEPERVQVCAQGLILRENGYESDSGVIYFIGSKSRVEVRFDDALVARTLSLLAELRATAAGGAIPPPLADSPKCPRCSLVGICLPDETNALRASTDDGSALHQSGVRRLLPSRDDALPLHVQSPRARVSKEGEVLRIEVAGEEVREARLIEVSQVSLYGPAQVTTPAIHELLDRGIPLCYFSMSGWFLGMTTAGTHKNVELRRAQFRVADDPARCLVLARRFVAAKIRNSRTFIRRNHPDVSGDLLDAFDTWIRRAERAASLGELLGIEGNAARIYFGELPALLRPRSQPEASLAFDFEGRNRRPPRDPVNAMLSLLYAVLAKELAVVTQAVGLDPYLGFYHQPRYGRPSLALDLMEEFRPLIADSVVVTAINTGVVGSGDFTRSAGGVSLAPQARRALLQAYERRMDQLVTHPIFGYRISYRRTLEVQTRLLARHLTGELPEFPAFVTR